jgi:hypothetical protein
VINELWIGKDFEESGRGLILRYYLGIRLEKVTETMKKLSQYNQSLVRDLNPRPVEYDAGALTTRYRRSVVTFKYKLVPNVFIASFVPVSLNSRTDSKMKWPQKPSNTAPCTVTVATDEWAERLHHARSRQGTLPSFACVRGFRKHITHLTTELGP